MIINTSQVEMVLSNKAVPAYTLEAETGMSRATISKYRKGEVDFEKISLKNIMKIQSWIDEGNFTFSYDYSELLEEFKQDMAEGLLGGYCYVVRGDWLEVLEYAPITDYYYTLDEARDDTVIKMQTEVVLREMEKWNKMF